MSKKRGQNEGTIFEERAGRWVASVTTGYVIRDGKRRRVRRKFVGSTRNAVQRRLTAALRDQHHGRNVSPRVQTLGAFLDLWLSQVAQQGVRPKTFRTYSDIVKLHIAPTLGSIQVERLTPDVVQAFLNDKLGSALCPHCKASINAKRMPAHITEMHAKAKARAFRPLGAKSVSHIRATLRGALAVAMTW
ncbi:MAG: N-terminal phage integrase SAM-like domain-containing protein, partial [Acidobacteriota bacterium]|nr:N-terminal phage integrase SAM-like domain-containing protein [Acidobacteriota bacterium]